MMFVRPVFMRIIPLALVLPLMLAFVGCISVVSRLAYAAPPAAVESELIIEVTTGVDAKTRIGVVPMAWLGDGILPEDLAEIVGSDLYRSGLFNLLPREDMLSRPTTPEAVMFREWRALGLDYLVVGSLSPRAGGYAFRVALFDVLAESAIIPAFSGTGANLRDIGHLISDTIYAKLTGIPGAFSTQILYVTLDRSGKQNHYRLRRADADGYRVVTLFESKEPILSPSWSPDGRKVAFVSYHRERRPRVFVQDIVTGDQKVVSDFRGINGAPAWSPDGSRLAMALSKDGNPEIYVMHLADGTLQRLTSHYAIDTEPHWMPDGQRLIFTSDRGGNPQIYQYRFVDHSVQRLTFNGGYNARGTVSADGRYLVMVHRVDELFHIAVQDLQRDAFRVLTSTPLDESPSIAPNGSMVIYATREAGEGVLSAVSLDGKVKVRLPVRHGEVREPAWSPYLRP